MKLPNVTYPALCLIILFSLFLSPQFSQAEKTGVVCITKKNSIIIRTGKCKSGETKGTLSNFAKKGDTGTAAVLNRNAQYTAHTVTVNASSTVTEQELCPAGQVSLGGGCSSESLVLSLIESYPFDSNPQAWKCSFANTTGSTVNTTITTLVICANAG